MISQTLKLSLLILISYLATACSDQYRIVNPGGTSEDAYNTMNNIIGVSSSGFDTNLVNDMIDDPTHILYYTSSGANGLTAESVFSVADVGPFVGASGRGLNVFNLGLEQVSVVFLDALSSENIQYYSLMIEFNYLNDEAGLNTTYKSIAGPSNYSYTDESFEVQFESMDGTGILVLRTTDLDEDYSNKLGTHVQFQIYLKDKSSGRENHIGQFSTLAGFGS